MLIRYIVGWFKYATIEYSPLSYSDEREHHINQLIYKHGVWYQLVWLFADFVKDDYESRAETFRELDLICKDNFEHVYFDDDFYESLVFSCFYDFDEYERYMDESKEDSKKRTIGFVR